METFTGLDEIKALSPPEMDEFLGDQNEEVKEPLEKIKMVGPELIEKRYPYGFNQKYSGIIPPALYEREKDSAPLLDFNPEVLPPKERLMAKL